ncbi:MAG: hypothetical protein WC748_05990 [Legionellales bacterium]
MNKYSGIQSIDALKNKAVNPDVSPELKDALRALADNRLNYNVFTMVELVIPFENGTLLRAKLFDENKNKKKDISLEDQLAYFRSCVQGVNVYHMKDWALGDIKPENFITKDQRVIPIDKDGARMLNQKIPGLISLEAMQTASYKAPENEGVTKEGDIYALGLVGADIFTQDARVLPKEKSKGPLPHAVKYLNTEPKTVIEKAVWALSKQMTVVDKNKRLDASTVDKHLEHIQHFHKITEVKNMKQLTNIYKTFRALNVINDPNVPHQGPSEESLKALKNNC